MWLRARGSGCQLKTTVGTLHRYLCELILPLHPKNNHLSRLIKARVRKGKSNTKQTLNCMGFPGGASGKEPACPSRRCEMLIRSLGWVDPLEKEMATHSSILAWRIPQTEESGRL